MRMMSLTKMTTTMTKTGLCKISENTFFIL